jgi:uncharacterized protein (TIGR02246 family)
VVEGPALSRSGRFNLDDERRPSESTDRRMSNPAAAVRRLIGGLFLCTADSPPMNPTRDPVAQALAAYQTAVYAKDVDAFVALFDADVHVFDMWGQWTHQGLAAWRAMAEGWFGSLGDERVVVEFSEVQGEAVGDLAYGHAFARFSARAADGQTLRSLDNRLTLVMRQQAGGWKIVHQHTSAPIDHASGKPLMQR